MNLYKFLLWLYRMTFTVTIFIRPTVVERLGLLLLLILFTLHTQQTIKRQLVPDCQPDTQPASQPIWSMFVIDKVELLLLNLHSSCSPSVFSYSSMTYILPVNTPAALTDILCWSLFLPFFFTIFSVVLSVSVSLLFVSLVDSLKECLFYWFIQPLNTIQSATNCLLASYQLTIQVIHSIALAHFVCSTRCTDGKRGTIVRFWYVF